jgi:pilus assembly protein CpaF
MEGNVITLQEIFSFKQQRIDAEGNVKGFFRFHGVRPKFIERFKVSGIKAQAEVFDPSKVVQV